MREDPRAVFESLRAKIRRALVAGEAREALELSDRALAWAEDHGSDLDRDLAVCNRGAVLIQLGRTSEAVPTLRRLLLSSGEARARHVAACNLSVHHDQEKDYERSRFYAGLALDHAQQAEDPTLAGRSHNRIANICIMESDFAGALHHYGEALELLDHEETERASVHGNIGYCLLTQERFEEGFSHLFRAWKFSRRQGLAHGPIAGRVRLALCYGYLEIDRSERAIRHGRAALEAGERASDDDLVKVSLYLLGEAHKSAGDDAEAADYYRRLATDYYPGQIQLVDLLMVTRTHRLINLFA